MAEQPQGSRDVVDGVISGAASSPPRTSRHLEITGPQGRLEAILVTPDGDPPAAAVFCHPHPLHGGTMHNKVVYRAAKGAVAAGLPCLRFNFRGVGQSDGRHDGGEGEMGDLRAAVDYMESRFPGLPLLVGGFSFGAAVGLRFGVMDPRVTALVGLGLPTSRTCFDFLEDDMRPLLLLHGESDPFGAPGDLRALADRRRGPVTLVLYPGQGHFLEDVLPEMTAEVTSFCRTLWPAGESGQETP
jgi:alpha/beta superfamily hydrolase